MNTNILLTHLSTLKWALALSLVSGAAWAQTAGVAVEGAWVRATVPSQKGTGAFMSLTAQEAMTLVGVSSPVAGVAEVHEMKMEGDIMTMRVLPLLELPTGKKITLKPGGYHIMLMDLKAPLALNSTVPVILLFKNAKGLQTKQALTLPVRTVAPNSPASQAPAVHAH